MYSLSNQPNLPRLSSPRIIVEIAAIIMASIIAISPFLDFGAATRLGGWEAEYLTRSTFTIGTLLRHKGYIPLWQPYLEFGDPMLENPVSFAFNPLGSIPSYLFGLYDGAKVTLLLIGISAGIGAWCLGRVLGFGMVARLLIAFLSLGKGNLHAYMLEGHFPLILAQAFFPWVFTAVVAIFRGHRRWAVALLIVSYAFIFWSGVPWYPPAIGLSIAILTLFAMFKRRWRIDVKPLAGVMLGVAGALLLTSALMIPLLGKADNIGETTVEADHRADLLGVMGLYFSNVKDTNGEGVYPQGFAFAYYNYMSPPWYALLVGALLLAVVVARWRRWREQDYRFVLGFLGVFIFCTLWGAGQNPIINFFYETIPYANQFRHVQRAFAISTLALIVLLAMGVDVIWRALVDVPIWLRNAWAARNRARRIGLRLSIGGALIVASGLAAYDVVRQWQTTWGEHFTQREERMENACITWLRDTYPNAELSVWTLDYRNIYTYLRNRVRHGWVASDFYHVRGIPSTLFGGWMQPNGMPPIELLPEFAIGITHFDDSWLEQSGYMPIEESVNPYTNGRPCLYRREGAYSYAWLTTRAQLDQYTNIFPVTETTPITTFIRDYDRIGIIARARSDADVVVTAQEAAYPGWRVSINDQPATLESLGGQIAVVLPRVDEEVRVYFQYLPQRFFLGAGITLATALMTILYLLRFDGLIGRWLRRRVTDIVPQGVTSLQEYRQRVTRWLDPAPAVIEVPEADEEPR